MGSGSWDRHPSSPRSSQGTWAGHLVLLLLVACSSAWIACLQFSKTGPGPSLWSRIERTMGGQLEDSQRLDSQVK